ncbi:MAG: primosomal protein N' [Candidatus Dependentiae bacterium]|nr:primosomal protein N' [Candidatus Dependentiae bacterium]
MYIQVKLLHGYQQPLWYHIPSGLTDSITIDSIVQVPLRNQIVSAIVMYITHRAPAVSFAIKEINKLEPFPADATYTTFIKKLAAYHLISEMHFLKRIAHFLHKKPKNNAAAQLFKAYDKHPPIKLTDEQRIVTDFLKPHISTPVYMPTVLHGVTASGKTEVYKELMMHAFAHNKTTLLLLPEVTLAQAFEKRLQHEIGSILPICGFHSGSSSKEKSMLWQRLLTKQPMIIIGVHLPILLPIAHLGLIIIDEEHEVGYQEKKHPKINTKDAAIMRAHCANIPLLLGSATPSLATLYNVKKRGWHFFQLKNRFAGAFPTMHMVSLADKTDRKYFWISQKLYTAIKDRIIKKEQIIIFLNRRGFSFFLQCKSCSFIFNCGTCSVSLTLHKNDVLTCHYCGYSIPQPTNCPQCKKTDFLKKGIGTQQVVSMLENAFPSARIARADMDTTTKKKEWQQTMRAFMDGEIDILVGTQTITKGYDFPNVTLVGILWADLNLHFPLFNAAETTLQQLVQVAGRAGRQRAHSEVIVQTMTDHPIFDYLNEIDYLSFYHNELDKREMLGYPPTKRLVEIELKSPNEVAIEQESHDLVSALCAMQSKNATDIQILGPAKPPVYKIKDIYMRKIYIKGEHMHEIIALFKAVDTRRYSSTIYFVPNPVT